MFSEVHKYVDTETRVGKRRDLKGFFYLINDNSIHRFKNVERLLKLHAQKSYLDSPQKPCKSKKVKN